MLTTLLTLTSLSLPAWDAPTWGAPVKSDTRPANAHEARVFLTASCEGRPDCQVEFLPIGQNGAGVPAANRRVPVNVAYGSFTRPGAQEVLLTLCSAESDACDGTTLLRRTGGRWKALHHTPGVFPSECLKFRRFDGRDQLACRENGMNMYGVGLYLVTADAKRTHLKTLLDGSSRPCTGGRTTQTRLGDWRKQDVNGDGRSDLVVEVYRYKLEYGQPEQCVPYDPDRVEAERTVRRFGM
ncbi:hypothetical protein [Deinococcus budaensis]|uniref:Uncharacterized protein n=1 Tax=Deinococcus budaensis TaxID=1665626 RepID=A0A7W8GEE8_9DEIO|nr:hypothetical protein [Deinococcus budaensis]MBB5233761.1 hypothetical protein [Deinococcus budaensis]